MENQDKLHFVELLTATCALYGYSLHELLIEIYWKALVEFEFSDVEQGFNVHIMHPDAGRFMPKPADIRRYLRGDDEVRALQAWSRLQQALRDIGGDQTVVFDDAILHQVVEEIGGWVGLAERTQESMNFLVHDFKKRYVAYALHPPDSHPRQLTGRFDAQNRVRQTTWLPILIGNPEKAEQVYRQGRAPGLSTLMTPLCLSKGKEQSLKQLLPSQKGSPNPTKQEP